MKKPGTLIGALALGLGLTLAAPAVGEAGRRNDRPRHARVNHQRGDRALHRTYRRSHVRARPRHNPVRVYRTFHHRPRVRVRYYGDYYYDYDYGYYDYGYYGYGYYDVAPYCRCSKYRRCRCRRPVVSFGYCGPRCRCRPRASIRVAW